jgi:hypothetical protein
VQAPGPRYLIQFPPDLGHAIADHAPVGLDLRFARATQEAEAATLPLKVRPAAHQPPRLIVKMSEFDLKSTLIGCRALAKDFQDKAGAINHLGLGRLFQIALLNGTERIIDDDQLGFFHPRQGSDLFDLAAAEQRRGLSVADSECLGSPHIDADR